MSKKVFVIKTEKEICISPMQEGIGKYVRDGSKITRLTGDGDVRYIFDSAEKTIENGVYELTPDGVIRHEILFDEIWIKGDELCQIKNIGKISIRSKKDIEDMMKWHNYNDQDYSSTRWGYGYELLGIKVDKYGCLPKAGLIGSAVPDNKLLEKGIGAIRKGEYYATISDTWAIPCA